MKKLFSLLMVSFFLLSVAFFMSGCTTKVTEKEYTQDGNLMRHTVSTNDSVRYELNRIFQNEIITGEGIFVNDNEGLARRTSINLAVAELGAKVQTRVQSETFIQNNAQVRDVVNNKVHVLVNGYTIDYAGYDPGTSKYRTKVSVTGEKLSREIEKMY